MDQSKVDYSEQKVEDLVKNYSWMIRPCFLYKEEYSDCTSIRSRFHQQFVSGEFNDCSQWNRDYKNCQKWKDDGDPKALVLLLESETKRRQERIGPHYANDVWKKRDGPPKDWDAPLPEWLEKKIKASYLAVKSEETKRGKQDGSSCVIS